MPSTDNERIFSMIESAVAKSADEAVYAIALDARSFIIREIQKQSKGETYTHHFVGMMPNGFLVKGEQRNKAHIASAPGDAPNTDSGDMVNSIALNPNRPASDIDVGSDLEYPLYLENGTVNMDPRPVFGPAAEYARSESSSRVRDALQRNLKAFV